MREMKMSRRYTNLFFPSSARLVDASFHSKFVSQRMQQNLSSQFSSNFRFHLSARRLAFTRICIKGTNWIIARSKRKVGDEFMKIKSTQPIDRDSISQSFHFQLCRASMDEAARADISLFVLPAARGSSIS